MVSVDSAHIIKFKSHGHVFEILVDLNLAFAVRQGKDVDMSSVVAVEKVFADARRAEVASPNSMKEVFGTEDPLEVARLIINKGELPMTTEYRHQLKEQKLKQIVNMIHRNAVDPQTHAPHPPQRIESALQEAKFHVDEFIDVQKQMQEALAMIRPILPIKLEIKEIAVKIPPDYAAKSYPIIQQFGKKLREDWQSDGSYMAVVEIPGGLEEDFHNKLNALCHGNVETKILKTR